MAAPKLALANDSPEAELGRKVNITDDSILRFMRDYADPAFGWKVASRIVASGQFFPVWPEGNMNYVWKAWLYQKYPGYFRHDESLFPLRKAAAINADSTHRATKDMLEALLLSDDATVENISEDTSIEVPVIQAYTQLFFDVLDRIEDRTYIRNQVYPDTRYEEMVETYFNTNNFGKMLRRAAYNRDRAACLAIGGYRSGMNHSMTAAQASDILQREFMVQALMLSTSGGLMFAQAHHTINGARGIIQAGKIGGTDTGSGNAPVGLLSAAIAETLGNDVIHIKADYELKALREQEEVSA